MEAQSAAPAGATQSLMSVPSPSEKAEDEKVTTMTEVEKTAMRLYEGPPASYCSVSSISSTDSHSETGSSSSASQTAGTINDAGDPPPPSRLISAQPEMSSSSTSSHDSGDAEMVEPGDGDDIKRGEEGEQEPEKGMKKENSRDTTLSQDPSSLPLGDGSGSTDFGTVETAASTAMETQGSTVGAVGILKSPPRTLNASGTSTASSASSSSRRPSFSQDNEPTPQPASGRRSDSIRQKVREKEEQLAAIMARKNAVAHQRKAKEDVRKKVREKEERLSALMKKQTSQVPVAPIIVSSNAIVPRSPKSVSVSSLEGTPDRTTAIARAKEKREKVRESAAKINSLMGVSRSRMVEIDMKEKEELDRKEAVRALAKVALELKGELHLAQKREKALEREVKHQERTILLAQAEKVELCHELLSLRAEVSQHEAAMETLQQTLEHTHEAHERLRDELERARVESSAIVPTALETVMEATDEDDSLTNPASLLWSQQKQEELEALEYQWTKKNAEYDRLNTTLQVKQKKIIELEVELDLLCFESEGAVSRVGSTAESLEQGHDWSKELEAIQEELGGMLSNHSGGSTTSPEKSSQGPSASSSAASMRAMPEIDPTCYGGNRNSLRSRSSAKEEKKSRNSKSPKRSRFGWLRRSGKNKQSETPEEPSPAPAAQPAEAAAAEATNSADMRRYQRLKERYKQDKLEHKVAMDQLAAENKDYFLKLVALENSLHTKHSTRGGPALDGSLSRSQDSFRSYNLRGAPVDVYEADDQSEPSEVVEKLVLWERSTTPNAVSVVRQPSLPNKAKYWEERAIELAHESSVKGKRVAELEARVKEDNETFQTQKDSIKQQLEQLQWQNESKTAQLRAMESVLEQQKKKSDRSVVVRADLWSHLNMITSLENRLKHSLEEVAYWKRQQERKDQQLAKLQKDMAELRYRMYGGSKEGKNGKNLSPIQEGSDEPAKSVMNLSSSTNSNGSGSLLADSLTAEDVVEEMNSLESWEDLRLTYHDPKRQASF
mmetsp:Transcript_29555/g.43584  ORF Transcript_29555/g.43584 Transcript_29555/m.43584 type:complete len:1009 (-) Transcript_29555:1270-4296(-)